MGTCLKAITFLILISAEISAQGMWYEYWLDNFSHSFGNGKTVGELKSIIINDDIDSSYMDYSAAATYLFYKYRDTEKKFLYENLKIKLYTTHSIPEQYSLWKKYNTAAFIKGLLGDKEGISMMTIIAESGFGKLEAIRRLAEAGIYNYYDIVKEKYFENDSYGVYTFSFYGNDKRYNAEVRYLLEAKARAQSNYIDIAKWANYIANFNHDLYIQIFDDHFEKSTGEEKYDTFFHLGSIDGKGQPARTLIGLENEADDTFRAKYIPRFSSIWDANLRTKLYLAPSFVYSLQQIPMEPGSLTFARRTAFMNELKPPQPDSTISMNTMLDQLASYCNECLNYKWVSDDEYKSMLLGKISNTKKYFEGNNLIECLNEISSFQKSIEEGTFGVKHTMKKVAPVNIFTKFLCTIYIRSYILDRLK